MRYFYKSGSASKMWRNPIKHVDEEADCEKERRKKKERIKSVSLLIQSFKL